MPIKIPDALPATDILEGENIFVMTEYRAMHQDIRPLKVLLLNLMPTKIVTETQIMRKLSNTPLQIEIGLLQTATHDAKNVSEQHLDAFYTTFDAVKDEHFDGLIITGAPVELLDFEDVDYWEELCRIMAWSATNVHSTLHICWGAQAGIYYHYGIPKYELPEKLSGVFEHQVVKPSSPLVRGFNDRFQAPHSRYTEVHAADIEAHPSLELIATSDEAGVYLAKSTDSRHFFVFGHPEYDVETLRLEYERDRGRGLPVSVPAHYFPNDDPAQEPHATWRAHAQLLYTNWLNYYVYQTTPYDLAQIGTEDSALEGKTPQAGAAGEGAARGATHAPGATREGEAREGEAREGEAGASQARAKAHGAGASQAATPNAPQPAKPRTPAPQNPYLRAASEDDDGYDPYSDRREEPFLFEPNPWD